MVNKIEIDMVIAMINSLIVLIETYNPSLGKNPVIAELQNAISALQALGL